MQWSDIPFSASSRTLRQFAGLWIVFFGALACWRAVGREQVSLGIVLGTLAVTVGVAGLVKPQWIRPIFVGWMILAFPIGWTISRIVLAIMFYGLFTPLGLFFRLTKRDVLCLRYEPNRQTYWARKPKVTDSRSYFRQF